MDRLFDRRAGLPRRPLANLALSPSDAKGDPLEQLCGSCSWPRDRRAEGFGWRCASAAGSAASRQCTGSQGRVMHKGR